MTTERADDGAPVAGAGLSGAVLIADGSGAPREGTGLGLAGDWVGAGEAAAGALTPAPATDGRGEPVAAGEGEETPDEQEATPMATTIRARIRGMPSEGPLRP